MKAVAEALVLAELGARVVQAGRPELERVPAAALALGEHLLSQKGGRASCPPFPNELVELSAGLPPALPHHRNATKHPSRAGF